MFLGNPIVRCKRPSLSGRCRRYAALTASDVIPPTSFGAGSVPSCKPAILVYGPGINMALAAIGGSHAQVPPAADCIFEKSVRLIPNSLA
jgi:hypothetical protein